MKQKRDGSETKTINEHQKIQYGNMEKDVSKELLSRFAAVLSTYKENDSIKILDIGGASGHFALSLKEYFGNGNCEVTVIDNTVFETWDALSNKVTCIKTSADSINEIFSENTFDIIFANRVFHHFVRGSWKSTVEGINSIIGKIYKILKNDGRLCITEHFFNGLLFDKMSSKIIYKLSSCIFKPIVTLCKKIGVESAGIGVCFLSYTMWFKLLDENIFLIESIDAGKNERIHEWYKKICFLNKENILDNIIIAKKYGTLS